MEGEGGRNLEDTIFLKRSINNWFSLAKILGKAKKEKLHFVPFEEFRCNSKGEIHAKYIMIYSYGHLIVSCNALKLFVSFKISKDLNCH